MHLLKIHTIIMENSCSCSKWITAPAPNCYHSTFMLMHANG